ncbi:hypothetical protein PR003_g13092 [Phytophthora rubi]|uniref:Uncharacterized protein n=1 Tax=Phytophthora rubi TaxID=129364 RepID=A0A6A4F354_9STRA|nr:hypothetical protein PF003_g36836 [Phytophthora fragariae]KAE9335274.1 hypothetical protein PR003_g13092 [Phytophthora rubi]
MATAKMWKKMAYHPYKPDASGCAGSPSAATMPS